MCYLVTLGTLLQDFINVPISQLFFVLFLHVVFKSLNLLLKKENLCKI